MKLSSFLSKHRTLWMSYAILFGCPQTYVLADIVSRYSLGPRRPVLFNPTLVVCWTLLRVGWLLNINSEWVCYAYWKLTLFEQTAFVWHSQLFLWFSGFIKLSFLCLGFSLHDSGLVFGQCPFLASSMFGFERQLTVHSRTLISSGRPRFRYIST